MERNINRLWLTDIAIPPRYPKMLLYVCDLEVDYYYGQGRVVTVLGF